MVFLRKASEFRTIRQSFLALGLLLTLLSFAIGQQSTATPYVSQEIGEDDGIPVIIKHLPEWESVHDSVVLTDKVDDLRRVLGERSVFTTMDLFPGSEAAVATYPTGKLLLVEYPTPQSATNGFAMVDALANVDEFHHRRIGNYVAIVFDSEDASAAAVLFDQIKYEKYVQWLGEDPYLLQKLERYFVTTGRDVALSTVLFISIVFSSAIGLGILAGFLFYRSRRQLKTNSVAFSDAGGLTRLNLDELSEPIKLES